MPVIDCHTHIHPNARGWGERFDASVTTLVDALRRGPVSRAVVLPIAPKVSNEFIAESCRRYPDQLIGFASVDPLGGKASLQHLEQAIEDLGLKGLKLHPRLQSFGRADFRRVLPVIRKAARLRIPVLLDGFPYGRGFFRAEAVALIGDLAEAVPSATLIMAHAGGHQVLEAFLLAKTYRNIFLDLSFTRAYYRGSSVELDLAFVIRKMQGERMLYGSDHPEQPVVQTYEEMRAFLEHCGLNDRQLEAVFGGNLAPLIA